jgi:hypothetical protein
MSGEEHIDQRPEETPEETPQSAHAPRPRKRRAIEEVATEEETVTENADASIPEKSPELPVVQTAQSTSMPAERREDQIRGMGPRLRFSRKVRRRSR